MSSLAEVSALLRSSTDRGGGWLAFSEPVDLLEAREPDAVPGLLDEVEEATEAGLYAVGWIAYEAARSFDPALSTRPPGRIPPARFVLFEDRRQTTLPDDRGRTPSLRWEATMTRAEHAAAVERIRRAIAAGELYQANLTFRLRSRWNGAPETLFARLYERQPVPHAGRLCCEDLAVCSLSPELFLSRDGERLRSRPMKGTAARQPGRGHRRVDAGAAALSRSSKDRAENVMIVDMVRNDLGRIARPGTVVTISLLDVEEYATVYQMTSTVEAESEAPLVDVVGALFPPASVTGAPKTSATRCIAALEGSPRGIYTGAFGWIGPRRRVELNVAIRTLVVDRVAGRAEYGVGGGIVWDSKTDAEYQECLDKAAVLELERAREESGNGPTFSGGRR